MDNQSQNQSQGNLAAQQALCPDPAGCLREGCNQNRDGSPCEFCPSEFFVESEQPNTDTDKGHQAAPQTGDAHGSTGRTATESDRELLVLAAKAAGIELGWQGARPPYCWRTLDAHEMILVHWNPLTDDGDALRLAVKLRLMVHVAGVISDGVHVQSDHAIVMEPYGSDPYAATRRAIVRAAAATKEPTHGA